MDVFDLRTKLINDYGSYIESFIRIRDDRIASLVDEELNAGLLWPEPLIQLNPSFAPGAYIGDLVGEGILHPECKDVFCIKRENQSASEGKSLRLHKHQEDAIRRANQGDHYVLTTGTGSGKSLSYIIPIVDRVLRTGSGSGIKAIVVYPMNALANSQFGELEKFLKRGYPENKEPVKFARYTGQESDEERNELKASPPDILLTNYVMLELILTRYLEKELIKSAQGLQFLVLDELHTYRGRQGADVALLVRRVRDLLSAPEMQCVGTSATIAGPGTYLQQQNQIAEVATRFYGVTFRPQNIIGETLKRTTEEYDWTDTQHLKELTRCISEPDRQVPCDYESFSRDLLLLPDADKQAKDLYTDYYSTQRLRKLAQKTSGTQHCDLYQSLRLIFEKLDRESCSELGLPALGSFLWSQEAIGDLARCDISNRELLDCIRALAFTVRNHSLIAVDYKNIGSEELGSIYESLLELHPEISADAGAFELKTAGGHERKTTGSYYTPTSLINCLLDSALEPVVKVAVGRPDPEKAILDLRICDPACGSGHFLVAAAHRIAKRLAAVRTIDEEPSPEAMRTALRDVIGHCMHGVDINPMSVELCKISLWLEAIEPGKPLSFLDHHIKCGNSLLGTTPALMDKGIPNNAFKPIEGDVKAVCNDFKRQNRDERRGQQVMLFDDRKTYPWDKLGDLTQLAANLDDLSDDDITSLEQKRERYEQLLKSAGYEYGHLLADLWCAAFFIKKDNDLDYAITEHIFRDVEKNPHNIAPWLKARVKQLAEKYSFFHWHLEFPSVFQVPAKDKDPDNEHTGMSGGFDVVLGNPPWDKMTPDSKEFFSQYDEQVRFADRASERALVDELLQDETISSVWALHRRERFCEVAFIKESGFYTLFAQGNLGKGDLNTYRFFLELALRIANSDGATAQIVPEGLYNGANAAAIRASLFDDHRPMAHPRV